MPANVETLMYARAVPWHGLGTKVEGLQTAQDALQASGLNWAVLQSDLTYASPDGAPQTVPDQVANIRSTDSALLGIVGRNYRIVQNADAFDWADALVDSGDAKYETAGSLFGGKRVFLSMELPQGVHVPGDDGEIKPYLLITNGHDGGAALQGSVTMVRVVCSNTWTLALKDATRTFKIRHSGSIEGKLAQAREALGITFEYMGEFASAAEDLMAKRVTEKQAEKVLKAVFPLPARAKANPARIPLEAFGRALDVYRDSPNLQNIRGTAWGLLQAVGEFVDHEMDYRGRVYGAADVRMDSLMYDGPGAAKKQAAFRILASRDFARVR